jgi:predicted TIM-barrel fold metal-dependent hydrolase
MAELPFVDTHIHFWDLNDPELRYSWLQPGGEHPLLGNIETIKMPLYGADQFIAETRFQNVSKAIHVQAALGLDAPVNETRWLQSFADRTGMPHGIVAAADLAADDVEAVLERHAEYPNLRGIRDMEAAEGNLVDERWRRGYSALARFGLVACVDMVWETMGDARDLAATYPDVVLCVDHAGFPRSRDDDYFENWRRGMRTVAEADNAVVKISGLGMFDRTWTVESLRPWVLGAIEAFGVERSFFGTNWPVDRMYSSYGDVLDAYAEIIAEFSRDERAALFAGNAERIFRI